MYFVHDMDRIPCLFVCLFDLLLFLILFNCIISICWMFLALEKGPHYFGDVGGWRVAVFQP